MFKALILLLLILLLNSACAPPLSGAEIGLGNYETTDGTGCKFSVNQELEVIW